MRSTGEMQIAKRSFPMTMLRRLGAAAVAAGLLAALPSTAGAAVQVGSSGWLWGNPQPQGNTLQAMSFAGGIGYAAGEFGTLLKTADGGATWLGLPAGTFTNLTEVQAVDADTLVAGGGCVGRRSDDGGATFSRIAFTPVESRCTQQLAAMWFPSEKTGYIVLDDGTVFKTTDGGTEFAIKVAIPGTRKQQGNATPTDVIFLDDATGFAATSDGKIFRTTNSADTWDPVNATNRGVRNITFVDGKIGYAVGDASLFLKTTDGGLTWTPKDIGTPQPQNLTAIRCASKDLCMASTREGAALVRTADGGDTFSYPDPSTDPIFAAGFATTTRVVGVGQSGSTVVSDDGGQTFTPVGGRLEGRFSRIRPGLVAGSAFAPGPDGTLGKTTDGGKTWVRGNVSTPEDVLDVSFPTVTEGYALDTAGGLFRSSSGGGTWRPLDTGSTADPNAVYAPDPNTVLVIGPTGIRRSTDAGNVFATVRGSAVQKAKLEDVDRAGSAIIAFGPQEIIRSTDKGRTWTSVRKPGKYTRNKRTGRSTNKLGLSLVDFADAKTGYVVDTSGRLWKTRDGGRKWTELLGAAADGAYGISFASATRGYLVIDRFGSGSGRAGYLLVTDDGGATWHPQYVVSTPIPGGGVAATQGTNYLLGGTSSLLYTTGDGDAGAASTLSLTTAKSKYKKATRIRVTGKLSPASGGELVTVSYRRPGSTSWQTETVQVAANGQFTTSWDIKKGTNSFVAQWLGNFRSQGDGSKVVTVKVGK